MQNYIAIKRQPTLPTLSLGLLDDPAKGWLRKAHALRMRRERLLKRRLVMR